MVVDSANDRIYLGNATRYIEFVQDMDYSSSSWPALFKTGLDATYHPKGGASDLYFNSKALTGTLSHLRTTENFFKLADGIGIGNEGGIKIEAGSTGSDTDDIMLYYDATSPDVDFQPTHWQLHGGGYVNEPIATHDWVVTKLDGDLATYPDFATIEASFVRYNNIGAVGNTSWQEWYEYVNDAIGDAAIVNSSSACRKLYRKNEIYNGFVRSVSTNTENNPIGTSRPIYSTSQNIASTVVERDANRDIRCDILFGQATSAQYADLAEKYTCDESLPVGTVVEVSDGTEYEVVPCTFELSPVIVGAVSENPAHLMLPIALTGRVPVRVVGEVNKGDFIVSAGNGQARKGEAHEITFKIGIALESSLQTPEKLVECIIK
jgi:hypothetical protein